MVEQSTRFEQAMIGGDPTALLGLCDAKAEGLPGEEGETWAFLRVHFQQDPRRWAGRPACAQPASPVIIGGAHHWHALSIGHRRLGLSSCGSVALCSVRRACG